MGSIQRNCQKRERERERERDHNKRDIWSFHRDANQTMQQKRETCYGIQQKKSNKDDGKENIFKPSKEL